MTTERLPDDSHRLAHAIGLILHPGIVSIPTLLLVLSDIPAAEGLAWTAIIACIVLVPALILIAYLRRRDRHTYQRSARLPIYIVLWVSVLVCLGLTQAFEAPRALVASVATLAVWLPLQLTINSTVTKISTHVAVITGCVFGVLVLGRIEPLPLQIGALLLIPLVAWARLVTKNHTLLQVGLGFLVGGGCVLVVMPLVLGL